MKLGASQFDVDLHNRLDKRSYVKYNDKYIHVGSKTGQTYIDHHNTGLRKNWIARHSKIQNVKGEYVITLLEQKFIMVN